MSRARPRYGVAGYPVAHSLSPRMHRAAYDALGIEADYLLLPIAPELFEETVCAMPGSGLAGINVTIPHKEAAAVLADSPSEAVRQIGAANTLTFSEDGIAAENTDAIGLIAALDVSLANTAVLVLGAGGTARAAVWALARAGAEVSVWNRTTERAGRLADQFGVAALDDPSQIGQAGVVVNTTTVGMDPSMSPEDGLAALSLTGFALGDTRIAVDFVYGGHRPAFTQAAELAGCLVVGGRELLARQGAASFELWFGRPAPLDAMRNSIVG